MGGSTYGHKKRRAQVFPQLQKGRENKGPTGRVLAVRLPPHPGQEAPDHLWNRRQKVKRVWKEVVYLGNSGGSGSTTSWKERVSCQKERDSWLPIKRSNGQESLRVGLDKEWQVYSYSCMSFLIINAVESNPKCCGISCFVRDYIRKESSARDS